MKTQSELNYIKGINTNALNNISTLRDQIKEKKQEIVILRQQEQKLTNALFDRFQKL